MSTTTWTDAKITKKLPSFTRWLSANGAQILKPTNEWEILRFKAGDTTSVIYRTKVGSATFTGESLSAWNAYQGQHAWRAVVRTKRKPNNPVIGTLLERDGNECFFCLGRIEEGFETVEHLVAATHGGPNHISNFVLAHAGCNAKAGHLSAAEKVAIRTQAILERERSRPI